jgi:hypothetical protein
VILVNPPGKLEQAFLIPKAVIPIWIGRTSPARGTERTPPESPEQMPELCCKVQTTLGMTQELPYTASHAAFVMTVLYVLRSTGDWKLPLLWVDPQPVARAVSPTKSSLTKAVGRRVC